MFLAYKQEKIHLLAKEGHSSSFRRALEMTSKNTFILLPLPVRVTPFRLQNTVLSYWVIHLDERHLSFQELLFLWKMR